MSRVPYVVRFVAGDTGSVAQSAVPLGSLHRSAILALPVPPAARAMAAGGGRRAGDAGLRYRGARGHARPGSRA